MTITFNDYSFNDVMWSHSMVSYNKVARGIIPDQCSSLERDKRIYKYKRNFINVNKYVINLENPITYDGSFRAGWFDRWLEAICKIGGAAACGYDYCNTESDPAYIMAQKSYHQNGRNRGCSAPTTIEF